MAWETKEPCDICGLRYTHHSWCNKFSSKQKKKEAAPIMEKSEKISQQEEFEKANILVSKVNNRENQLQQYKKELGDHLAKFDKNPAVKFKRFPNTEITGMIFSGILSGKLVIGASKCSKGEEFIETIGKLIAVRRSLNLDTKDIYEFLDKNQDIKGILI